MNIKEMQSKAWANSEAKGFHDADRNAPLTYVVATKLMLAVSELSEALEELRTGAPILYRNANSPDKPEGLAAELADVVIRVGDLAGIIGFDLEAAVVEKMAYNSGRPEMHGGKKI